MKYDIFLPHIRQIINNEIVEFDASPNLVTLIKSTEMTIKNKVFNQKSQRDHMTYPINISQFNSFTNLAATPNILASTSSYRFLSQQLKENGIGRD